MTSREKVIEAESQVREVVAGEREWIDCPFCGLNTTIGQNMLCCDDMSTITNAVLDHVDHLDRSEAVARMLDRLDQMQSKAVLN